MTRNLDITLLRTFVTVSERANMTAAGKALHLTQSAVSQQVARLEELAGVLFSRDRPTLRLTATGERLLGKARRLLALNDELWADMSATVVNGKIRLGAPYDLVATCLGPIFKLYGEIHPQVEITLTSASSPGLLAFLARGELDLALVEEPIGPTAGECLAVDRLVWVGAKGGTAYLRTPVPISMVAETCAFRSVVLDALGTHDLEWRVVFENGSIDATAAMVRSDIAVTVWLASTVPPDLAILPTSAVLPALPPFAINLHLATAHPPAAVAELVHLIQHRLNSIRQAA